MVSVYWLLAGATLMALEAFGIPGIGFLFAGIAAILVGGLIELGLIPAISVITQWAVFFFTTVMFAALLWNKMKSWRMNPNAPHYSNIVGTEAVVTKALQSEHEGEVRWSGTLMRAKLADKTGEVALGATVIVREMHGNILLVAPR